MDPALDATGATDIDLLTPDHRDLVYGRGLVLLWAGLLGGPLVWAADLQTAYLLVYYACHTHNLIPLYLETALALALCAVAFVVAWRMFRRLSEVDRPGVRAIDRARFMAITGMGLSVLSFLVLVAEAVPRLVLTPCP